MSEITVRALTIQHNDPINTNFPYLFICLTHEKSVVRSLSLDDIPLVTSNVFPAPQYSSLCGLEGPVTELAVFELLKAGKVAELRELYRNWDIESD